MSVHPAIIQHRGAELKARIEELIALDEGDNEHNLGWSNPRFGDQTLPNCWSANDCPEESHLSGFNGDGHQIGLKLLREHMKDKRKLGKVKGRVRASLLYGRTV
ncbi:hypothetical protein C6558_03405 [Ensifer sp. NM-2]|uniref:hypothetical protein n=1 Tax=Ensifer sp. NM-2 TaxID=2109730 RepID=UPI000D118FDD|nr:hypothetical protein [Ensifer sp. NM-2]PSS67072.1 hypothetical protein C6558_03405 [Ensifer sp. NM-2]